MPALRLEGLTKHYGQPPKTVRALDGLDLEIGQGEFVAAVGRSGSGKTTMLDCIGLLMRPTSGRVILGGVDTGRLNDRQRADLRSHRIGFIFQEFNLLPTMSALENVLLPLRYSGGDRAAGRRRAQDLLEEMGLAGRMHHRPTQLSGGEQQRVAIARSLIGEPTLVLGDEPMGEVDTETSAMLLALMRRINIESNVTFLVVTHDLDLASRMDRIVRLRDGHLIGDERDRRVDTRGHEDRPVTTARSSDGQAALSAV